MNMFSAKTIVSMFMVVLTCPVVAWATNFGPQQVFPHEGKKWEVSAEDRRIMSSDLRLSSGLPSENGEMRDTYFSYKKLKYTGWSRVTPFAEVGYGKILLDFNDPAAGTYVKIKTHTGLAWGSGAEVLIKEWSEAGVSLSVLGAFNYFQAGIDQFLGNGDDFAVSDDDVTMKKYTFAATLSKRFNSKLALYTGVSYQRYNIESDSTIVGGVQQFVAFENDKRWGGFIGIGYKPFSWLALSVEGHFGSEDSITSKVTLIF